MVLNIPVSQIIADIGHDGSEICWPQFKEPLCRRGFHIQELILVAYYKGVTVTPFEALPLLVSGDGKPIDTIFSMPPKQRLGYIMDTTCGIITGATMNGQPHAVSWNGKDIVDPNGTIYPSADFMLETYWLMR